MVTNGANDSAGVKTGTWRAQLIHLLSTKGRVTSSRKKVKPVSNRTIDWRQETLFIAFRQLEKMGMCPQNVKNFGGKHAEALIKRWEIESLAPSTIANRISVLRVFTEWIGKKGCIKASSEYVSDPAYVRRSTNAQYDHSWSAKNIDADALIGRISDYDQYVAMQLKVMAAFGLRREEAIMLKPFRAEREGTLVVRDGTKGGRERTIPIETIQQRDVLEEAKALAKTPNGHLGTPGNSLEQSLSRFAYVLRKFGITKTALGITAHGLRHEMLADVFEKVAGVSAPIRGGDIKDIPDEQLQLARHRVSQIAGHARLSISGAYIGGIIGRKSKSTLNPQEFEKLREYTALKCKTKNLMSAEEKDRYIDLTEWYISLKDTGRL